MMRNEFGKASVDVCRGLWWRRIALLFISLAAVLLADAVQAGHLQVSQGAALIRSVTVNVDAAGSPVEFGITWFVGDRVTLTVIPD